jgi:hypothetical protein
VRREKWFFVSCSVVLLRRNVCLSFISCAVLHHAGWIYLANSSLGLLLSYKQDSRWINWTTKMFLSSRYLYFLSRLYNRTVTQFISTWHTELLSSWVSSFPCSCVTVP